MSKIHPVVQFFVILIFLLGLSFFAHTVILSKNGFSPEGNMIVAAYVFNFVIATLIYSVLFIYRKKLRNHIGFLFLGGSFLKFIFFFILFYPTYKADGEISKLEFAAFFIPYVICLALETIFTAKMLNKLE